MHAQRHSIGLSTAFSIISLAYILALGVAITVGYLFSGRSPILMALVADIAATCVIYIFGRMFRNSSFYDPYWSLAPLAISIYWTLSSAKYFDLQQFIILALVYLWGLRLTWHWASGWRGLGHEDWRYSDLRQRTGGWFWLVELFGIDMMPTLVVFLGCLSLYPALTSNHTFGALDVAAIIITATAIIIESVADEQLRRFVNGTHRPGEIMESGLWMYSRHPNYLGEITFWWGLYLFALASGLSHWWTIIGPLTITALFVFISVPMMDRRMAKRHARYLDQRKKVPALLPRFTRP
jgi:steroid 5-alpha reductase family enzyme